ncbi:hypothetical protein [Nitratireductor sp. XY-223]|uniref:hypothetical protein n=1 Tax=Nitratireductor sp. XY-223 TaxID=2561926 RepID=UPI0010AA1BDC|nr:hypothetical protein [Nitratireductor sp. XY-223]
MGIAHRCPPDAAIDRPAMQEFGMCRGSLPASGPLRAVAAAADPVGLHGIDAVKPVATAAHLDRAGTDHPGGPLCSPSRAGRKDIQAKDAMPAAAPLTN